jgi:hypothetical protein
MGVRYRSIAAAFGVAMLLTGCASRRQLSSSPAAPVLLPKAIESPTGKEAADRVKDAITSLSRQMRKRGGGRAAKTTAELDPIPLISWASRPAIVGTSGLWSVVQATHEAPRTAPTLSQTQTQYREPRGSRHIGWILVGAGVAFLVALFTLRAYATRSGLEHS